MSDQSRTRPSERDVANAVERVRLAANEVDCRIEHGASVEQIRPAFYALLSAIYAAEEKAETAALSTPPAAAQDTVRLDWLETSAFDDSAVTLQYRDDLDEDGEGDGEMRYFIAFRGMKMSVKGDSLRAAIDADMEGDCAD